MKKWLYPMLVLNLLLIGFLGYKIFFNSDKTVYIDSVVLFKDYKFKQDLEKKSEQELVGLKHGLDSLTIALQVNPKDEKLRIEAQSRQKEWLDIYNKINSDINQQVWSRLNPIIESYGSSHHYSLILGANGNGTILYGKTSIDITSDFVKYANKKYENAE